MTEEKDIYLTIVQTVAREEKITNQKKKKINKRRLLPQNSIVGIEQRKIRDMAPEAEGEVRVWKGF